MTNGHELKHTNLATARILYGLILFPVWFPVILFNSLAHATARATDRLLEELRRTKNRWMLRLVGRVPVAPPKSATEFRVFVRRRSVY